MKKVAIIGTVGLPANYGGFETLASQIVKNLSNKYEFTVYCSSKKYKKSERLKNYLGAKLKFLPLNANGAQSVFYDTLSIIHALFYADVLLVLGVAGAWIFPFVRLFTRKKIIVSIDGVEWKREKWGLFAKMYLWWAEKIAVKYSHIDISDNESIQDYTALRYDSLSRIIEYGGDHVENIESQNEDHEKFEFLKYLYAIKVCRIEPENNVHVVLEAFAQMDKWFLVIVGNWSNSEYGRNLRDKYFGFENIFLLDPIYDARTLNLLRSNAFIYIHGHSAGGTNPSLVEAMSHGLPVLAFNVSYNRTTTEGKARYFYDTDELVTILSKISMERLKENAGVMKEIANRRYRWNLISEKYDNLIIESLIARAKTPVMSELATLANTEFLLKHKMAHLQYQQFFYENR